MKTGVVKFFNEAKGFGFIKEDGGQEIFVHASGLKEDIRENDNVVFEIQEGKKGLNAVNVKLA
ncbi:MAG: cold shock domain-containing protein [Bacteroidia bacterium]|jgi:CspA family cold shock protein|nr:cold shock domain-containing protein [Bacteroidota bacterium]MBL7912680.1 cold shock domain-containing protein [Bacteroidia bacterium]MBA3683070.1 cold shock domain-containing protein [Bacteroidota bacterium]MDO8999466.1 cold shock domain-containing protein [Bacteroidota bacterium]MDP1800930.1 cold shock domain-containing protein [Bacteroidota bacterium]